MDGPSTRSTPINVPPASFQTFRAHPSFNRSVSASSSSSSTSSTYSPPSHSNNPYYTPSSSHHMTHIDLSESPKYIESLGTSSGYAWNEQFLVSPSASRYYRRRVLGDGGSGSGDVEKVFVDEILLE